MLAILCIAKSTSAFDYIWRKFGGTKARHGTSFSSPVSIHQGGGTLHVHKARPLIDSVSLQEIDTLATLNSKQEEIQNAAIFVKGNIIEWVGETKDLPEKYQQADEIVTLKDRVVIPGMVRILSEFTIQAFMPFVC